MTTLRSTRALPVRDTRSIHLLAALAVIGVAHVAVAAPRCEKSCKAETTGCIADRCAGLGGQAERECVETCKGIGGCARIGTVAWVMSTCTERGYEQKLQIRRGDCDPVTVLDFPEPSPSLPCDLIGSLRFGFATEPPTGAFHRLGVSPNGKRVVFEVADDFSMLGPNHLVPAGQKEGIFVVQNDGRGLRLLGPASRDPSFDILGDPTAPGGFRAFIYTPLSFKPNGASVVLTDLGPGPGGEQAIQIFTLDIATGTRTQLTHLPFEPPHPVGLVDLQKGTCCPVFLSNGRISFLSFIDIDGLNPERDQVQFVMNSDGSGLERVPLPVVAGRRVVPIFQTTPAPAQRSATVLAVPGVPVNVEAGDTISEIFFFHRKSLLQLTNFGRTDTTTPDLTPDGKRVLFAASADPFGTNPSGTCQLFSVSTEASGLRQLTRFSSPEHSVRGCLQTTPPGCRILPYGVEPATATLVFYSSCDPFGTNPSGDQLFAISANGTHLRQLTHARGLFTDANGTVSAENIGPIGHSPIAGQY